jgi:uncharacterized membrane protein
MPSAQHSVTIDRPVGDVFAFVDDHTNDRRWRPGVLEIRKVGGDGRGARWAQTMRGPMGRGIPSDFEVTEYEPNRRIGFRATAGPVRPEGRYEFADDGGATRVTFALSADLSGAQKLMSPMVGKAMRNEVQALAELKRVLEQQR